MNGSMLKVSNGTVRRHGVNDPTELKGGLTTPAAERKRYTSDTQTITRDDNVSRDFKPTNPGHQTLMTQPSTSVQLPKWDATPGQQGIYNHGNTCFMNTILQCLSCTDLFADYFVQKKYKEIFNTKGFTKRLVGSTKGEVCEVIGRLLESLWSGSYNPEISSHLKSVLSKYNVQYKGSSQHDAQEFLLWLLDRLNEELHQSSKKKAKDTLPKSKKDKTEVSALSSPEIVLSACSGFEVYNRFQALYQSSLTCPNCRKQSNTYESYLCLSLPVPQKSIRPVYVTVVYLDDSPKQLRIALELNIMDTVKELREKLAHELYVTPKRLVLCQVNEIGFCNTYGDDQPLSDIHESENVYVFETYPFCEVNKTPGSDLIQIMLVHVEKSSPTRSYRFCCPELIKINRDIDFLHLQRCILRSMRFAVSDRVVEQSSAYTGAIFDIRVVDSGPKDSYLETDVEMPLYTEPIDRALSIYNEDYGPTHVKFVIEWDPEMKRRLVEDDEDTVEEHQSVHKTRLSQQQPSSVSLEECLKLFTKEETLGEGDVWQCPNCDKNQEGAIKKLGLWSAPDILVIHLKRFRHSGVRRNKLNILVNFPVSGLEMGHHLLPETDNNHGNITSDLYDLYAVSNHYGNMSGGHYTAFCKNPVDMRWYEFDDTNVRPLPQREIVSKAAYLLFYQRQKFTLSTVKSLQAQKHWVFSVYGPPRSMQAMNSSPLEEVKPVLSSPSGGKNGTERDYSDYYVDRVRLDNTDNYSMTLKQSRSRSEPPDTLDLYEKEEHLLREQLRLDAESPRDEKRNKFINSPRDTHGRDKNSPLREEMGINSPRQSVKHESPRKELFSNRNQNISSQTHNVDENTPRMARHKTTVAEQIARSKPSGDRVDSVVSSPRNFKNIYRRSDSVDSSKNSYSYTSGSEISPTDSSPPSPLDDYSQTSSYLSQNQANNRNKSNNLLNNERDVGLMNGHVPNSVSLKIHSNQIRKGHSAFGSGSSGEKRAINNPPKTDNQKVNNNGSGNVDKPPTRPDIFSTPQQVRKSPSPPVITGRGWSTPQPRRKQYSDKPQMDRQFSVPPRIPLSLPPYSNQNLEIEGHAVDKQPRSLPVDMHSASKPPLPTKSSHSAIRKSYEGSLQDNSRNVSNRPSSAYSKAPDHVDGRVPGYSEKPVSAGEWRPATAHSREPSYSDSRPVIISQRSDDQSSRGRNEFNVGDQNGSGEVRSRNRSADRQDRRSMRARTDRPISYHQSTQNDTYDQYYLTQPFDDVAFERSGRYSTMQPVRQDYHVDQFDDNDYLHRHSADPRMVYHTPRSRAPINPYNPQLYQDHSSYAMPRYQPHLQTAKMMTKLALQEKEHIERRLKQKMKSEYLKESSV